MRIHHLAGLTAILLVLLVSAAAAEEGASTADSDSLSALIDLLAELLRTGSMTRKARLKGEFFICEGVSITQPDIYQLITAKVLIGAGGRRPALLRQQR